MKLQSELLAEQGSKHANWTGTGHERGFRVPLPEASSEL